ncbi:MAG: SDR family oxidoreductase [Chloroflexi bacterium]|nr:SDR family oxidoreductase [Chloroflexota bacterium]
MIPQEWDLSGKRALITADRRGWTPYLASALAEAGADVAVAGWRDEHVAQAAQEVEARGRRSLRYVGNLAQRAGASTAVEAVVGNWGGVDILVNAAQAQFGKPFVDIADGEWDRLMGYNVRAMFLLCQEAGRHMLAQGNGRIVNVISGLAERGLWNSVAYCASQGAVVQLTRALALEWSQKGVRVNAIAAGWMALEEGARSEEEKDPLSRFIPLRRLGHPRELGPLLVYLASDACDFVTGQTLFVDGGAIAHG